MSGGITDDNQRGHAATSGRNTTETERHKAALYVCHRAKDGWPQRLRESIRAARAVIKAVAE